MNEHSGEHELPCCGHVEVAHEVVISTNGTWVATDADTLDLFGPGEIEAAVAEDRVWLYCGACEDGCHRTTLDAAQIGRRDEP